MTKPQRQGYSGLQIGLHWAVVALVTLQFLAHEGMEHSWRAAERGTIPAPEDLRFAYLHIGAGMLIFILAAWRVFLRFSRGAPPPPQEEHAALRLLARATHFLLYVLLLGMPVSGSVAWFAGIEPAAEAHETATNVLLALIALHVAGALVQHFVFRTRVLARMLMAED